MAEVTFPGQDKDALTAKLDAWGKRIDAHWSSWMDEARQCFDFAAGRPWTQDEIADMQERFKVPVSFDLVGPLLDAVAGAEINARQRVQYFPREVNDSQVDEVITQGANWIMDQCGGDQEDSDAFRDLLICGVGVTETRPEAELETEIIKERVDPLEMGFDPSSMKRNFSDARYLRRRKPMARDEAETVAREMGWPDVMFTGSDDLGLTRPTIVDPQIRYTHGMLGQGQIDDEVIIEEWQWWDYEERRKVALADGSVNTVTEEEYGTIPPEVISGETTAKEKCFYQAFVIDNVVVEYRKLEVKGFSYQAMTGKRDRNKRVWYGLVRPMQDPQRWVNKLYSELINIMRSNAQGGVMVEEGMVDDVKEFEETWADASSVSYLAKGALQNGAVQPKPVAQYPQGLDRLMEIAKNAMRDVTGINQELLGLADRQQPGVLEQQRKQAAYGILSPFFDALGSYRRRQGMVLLQLMRIYLPPSKLVRVVGDEGLAQYVPMALDKKTAEYDVIVDEAPNSPNQKAQIFQVILALLPMLQNADMPAAFWGEVLKYCPLPASLAQKIATMLTEAEAAEQKAQAEAAEQQRQQQQQMMQLGMAKQQADIGKTESDTQKNQTAANLDMAKAFELLNPQQQDNDQ